MSEHKECISLVYPLLANLDLSDEEAEFLQKADTAETAKTNQTRVTATVYQVKHQQSFVET